MTDTAVPVRWQVAKDRNFRKSVQTGTAVATPEVWATRMRGLDSVATKESNISDVAKFRITAGSVGATLIE